MRIRLTQKCRKALHHALSLDDVLYEQFRRLHEQLQRERRAIYRAKDIVSVMTERDGVLFQLCIKDVQVSPNGTRVICKG